MYGISTYIWLNCLGNVDEYTNRPMDPMVVGLTLPKIQKMEAANDAFQKKLSLSVKNIWMFPKIVGFPPKSSIFSRDFHYFHHPFWGLTSIFGNTHIKAASKKSQNHEASHISKYRLILHRGVGTIFSALENP